MKIMIVDPYMDQITGKGEGVKSLEEKLSFRADITAEEAMKLLKVSTLEGLKSLKGYTLPNGDLKTFSVEFTDDVNHASPLLCDEAHPGQGEFDLYLRTSEAPYIGETYVSLKCGVSDPRRRYSLEAMMALTVKGRREAAAKKAAGDGDKVD